ncbi:hypothetical protein ACFQ1B_13440 [Streptomyces mexicanus]
MGAVVGDRAAATASAEHEVRGDRDRGHDRHRADDQGRLLLAAARRRRLRHGAVGRLLAVGSLAVGLLRLAVRRLLLPVGVRLRRHALRGLRGVAVPGLRRGRRRSLLGVAVAGLGGRCLRRLLAVGARLAVRSGLLWLPAVRARLVVTHYWVPLQMLMRS